jgi:cobyrinic acid a,c-diamide synthase
MPSDLCRELFARASHSAELSLIEGTLDEPNSFTSYTSCDYPGELRPIAQALDSPIVAVVSCRASASESLHLPRLPEGIDAVLLDELTDPAMLPQLRRLFGYGAKLPVIAAIGLPPLARAALEKAPRDRPLPDDLISVLAEAFWKHADLETIDLLARSRPFCERIESRQPCRGRRRRGFRVGYAQDEAFGRYFPDTMEALEALGADLQEFSPLRDERLPDGIDLVMIGCGMPDPHADMLASNVSMMAALRQHVCQGHRIYCEGGGAAYLGQSMIIAGRRVQGGGIFPFDAELLSDPQPPAPVTRILLHDTWLGARGTEVRGYKSGRWRFTPRSERLECPQCVGPLSAEGDWYFHHHAVGSLLHLHLGALPEVVDAFAGPHPPSLRRPTTHG